MLSFDKRLLHPAAARIKLKFREWRGKGSGGFFGQHIDFRDSTLNLIKRNLAQNTTNLELQYNTTSTYTCTAKMPRNRGKRTVNS